MDRQVLIALEAPDCARPWRDAGFVT
jgi:hypothetical protein